MSRFFVALLCSACLATDLDQLIDGIRKELKPEQAMRYMRDVHSTDRYFTFPAFEKTSRYLLSTMKQIGLSNAEIVNAPADGVTQVGYWTMPLAWDVKSARLEILGSGVVLADYEQVPASLGMWSGPTPPKGIEAEIVAVTGAELRKNASKLHGKVALLSENPANLKWLLVRAGALGAINTFTENPGLQDGRQWINAWGDDGWAYTKRSTPLLSFSITPRQSAFVRELLKRGPVRVKATVNSRYYEGSYPYVTGVIQGTSDEEVLTLGHTSEIGAHDNATGVAATLEALGTLKRLIDGNKLPQPKRSIRILLMGEMYGSMHYVAANADRIRRTVAALCVDTPAGSYDLAGTEYTFHMNPHVAKDFTDAFILKVAASYFPKVGRPWHEKEFATGTDTYLAEPMVGVPTVWSYSGSGVETHHNSEDTPDRVDVRSLRDLSTVTAAFLYFIANAGEEDALWLAGLSETRGYEQMLKRLASAEQIRYMLDREKQAVSSVLRLVARERRTEVETKMAPMHARLERFAADQLQRVSQHAAERQTSPIVVKRKRFGTLPLDDLPHEKWEGQPSGAWALRLTLALYWCDGKRSLTEVIRLTELELGPSKFDYVTYFKFLEKHGYVEFVKSL